MSHVIDIEEYDALLRDDMSLFTQKVFHAVDPIAAYKHNWHVDLICEYLMACYRGEISRLVINIPPRNLKSIICSIAFPAWVMGHNPSEQFITAAFKDTLATRHLVDCRHVMRQPWYQRMFPETRFSRDQNEKTRFQTTRRGHRFATSVRGGIVGEGGNFLMVDDGHNPKEALGDKDRQAALMWFDQEFITRLNDKLSGCIIVIGQRLHAKDLPGHCLELGYEHLNIPAGLNPLPRTVYSMGGFKYIRQPGELLHPEREPVQVLEEMKNVMNSELLFGYEAQYEQNPTPIAGGIIKKAWINLLDSLPPQRVGAPRRKIQSWDTAGSTGGNYSSGGNFVQDPDQTYLTDAIKKQWLYPDLKKGIQDFAAAHEPDLILIEDKASGSAVIQDLQRETTLPILPINPGTIGDKELRFHSAAPFVQTGNFTVVDGARNREEYHPMDIIKETIEFPRGTEKDTADMLSQAWNYIRKNPVQAKRVASGGRLTMAGGMKGYGPS